MSENTNTPKQQTINYKELAKAIVEEQESKRVNAKSEKSNSKPFRPDKDIVGTLGVLGQGIFNGIKKAANSVSKYVKESVDTIETKLEESKKTSEQKKVEELEAKLKELKGK